MAKKIIALTGPIASGKDVTKKYIEEKYGASSVKFSQILRDVLNRLCVPLERENLQKISFALRQSFGDDLLSKIIAEDAKNLDSEIVILDGARRMTDIEYAKKLPSFHLIRIDAAPEIRYQRAVLRNENVGDAEKTFEHFLKDHEAETEITIPEVMNHADSSLDNNGTFEDLYRQIDELMNKF